MRNHKFNAVNKSSILSTVSYQNKHIWYLKNLEVSNTSGGGGTSDTTAANQLALVGAINTLNADLKNNFSSLATNWVEDDNEVKYWAESLLEADTGIVTTLYYDNPGGTIQVPTGALKPCTEAKNYTVELCMCDDVNGDGTQINQFRRLATVDYSGNIVDTTDLTLDLSVSYTAVNPAFCCDLGVDAETKQNSIVVTNSTWSPSKLMRSYIVRVKTINDTLLPPTFTGSNGSTRPLDANEVLGGNVSEDALFDITPVFTANTGDELIISYTTY